LSPIKLSHHIHIFSVIRLQAIILDGHEEEFKRQIIDGSIELCVSSQKTGFKECNLNVLNELKMDPTKFSGSHSDVQGFDMTLDLVHATPSSRLTACHIELSLFCCISDDYFKEEEEYRLQQKALALYSHIKALSVEVDSVFIRNPMWHCWPRGESVHYVIGIKSFALNFDLRDAIRKTWIADLTDNVCVVFLVGRPKSVERVDVESLLQVEQALYGDLLLSELGAHDNYKHLVSCKYFLLSTIVISIATLFHNFSLIMKIDKTVNFFHWSLETFNLSSSSYVIVSDDDVYVNISHLNLYLSTAPISRFYAGEMRSIGPQRPQRCFLLNLRIFSIHFSLLS
jgi:hypothetical protein